MVGQIVVNWLGHLLESDLNVDGHPARTDESLSSKVFSRVRVHRLLRPGSELSVTTPPDANRFYPTPPKDANNRGSVGFSHKKHEKSREANAQFLWLFVFLVAIIRERDWQPPSRNVCGRG